MGVTEFRQAVQWANEPDSGDPRTYISGLWPTWVGASAGTSYLQALEGRWGTLRDNTGAFKEPPQWPYFDIAEAHQWLFFDRQDKVWATLNWFWDHQASPGLFTWCEGTRRYASGGWAGVRGWVGSPCVTPHYWAAAEMLLLQLDMLTYVDQATVNPALVIGAGIPSAWLHSPMSVRGLPSRVGEVDWTWNGREMNISIRGCHCPVRLGSAFPPNTPVHVQYLNVNEASQFDDPAIP
jgi:hypothetical protein